MRRKDAGADRTMVTSNGSVQASGPTSSDRRLKLVARVTGAVVGSKPLVQQAGAMARQVRATLGVDACVIRLLEGGELVLLATAGVSRGRLQPRIRADVGIAKELLSRRQPLVIPDVYADPVTALAKRRWRTSSSPGMPARPLMVQDRVVGIFGVYARRRIPDFSDADLSCLQICANHIACAVVNHRLYEEVKDQRDRLKAEVAERKRTEGALHTSEERYRAVVQDQTEFICRYGDGGVISFVNDAAAQVAGESAEDLIGRSFFEFLDDDGVGAVRAVLASLDREHPVGRVEHRVALPGAEARWHQWTNRAIFDRNGRVVGYQAVGQDITERKRADAALRESEAKYRTLVETTDTGFVILDGDGRVLDANAEYVRLTGHHALREILGRSVVEWTAKHDVVRNAEEVPSA